jgi:hypothetical protein
MSETFWRNTGRDLVELVRHPRDWWWNATHASCPVCGQPISVGHEWQAHKLEHDPGVWQAATSRDE